MSTEAAADAVNRLVAPGDRVLRLPPGGQLRVGPGLQQEGEHLTAARAGVLRRTKAGKLWIEGRQKRYIPAVEDAVIGIVTDRFADSFTVDIGGPFPAVLPVLAFEGATRRNRPALGPGDLVYARVTVANRDMDPTLACTDASGKAAGFGPLKEGYLFSVNSGLARALLARPPAPVLAALGGALQFELAVGLNGRCWVHSPSCASTVLVANAVANSEFLSAAQAQIMVKALLAQLQTQQQEQEQT